jgi:hypothetical protein
MWCASSYEIQNVHMIVVDPCNRSWAHPMRPFQFLLCCWRRPSLLSCLSEPPLLFYCRCCPPVLCPFASRFQGPTCQKVTALAPRPQGDRGCGPAPAAAVARWSSVPAGPIRCTSLWTPDLDAGSASRFILLLRISASRIWGGLICPRFDFVRIGWWFICKLPATISTSLLNCSVLVHLPFCHRSIFCGTA